MAERISPARTGRLGLAVALAGAMVGVFPGTAYSSQPSSPPDADASRLAEQLSVSFLRTGEACESGVCLKAIRVNGNVYFVTYPGEGHFFNTMYPQDNQRLLDKIDLYDISFFGQNGVITVGRVRSDTGQNGPWINLFDSSCARLVKERPHTLQKGLIQIPRNAPETPFDPRTCVVQELTPLTLQKALAPLVHSALSHKAAAPAAQRELSSKAPDSPP